MNLSFWIWFISSHFNYGSQMKISHIYIYIYIYIEREREREKKNLLQPIFIVQLVQPYKIVQNYMKRFHILYEIYGKSMIMKRFI